MIHNKLLTALTEQLKEQGVEAPEVHLERPADLANGDYASGAALQYAKALGQNPYHLAENIAESIRQYGFEQIERIETAGPGFINFYLSEQYFVSEISTILEQGDKYGSNERMLGQKVIIEYTDPNPFKVFHIGHLMTNIIGECFARLYENAGAEVKRANYQGDVGLHVARAIWGIIHNTAAMPPMDTPLAEKMTYLGAAYASGTVAYEDNADARLEIVELNKKIYDRSDKEINRLYDLGREWSLAHFEELYAILGTKFDYYFFESQAAEPAKVLVQEYRDKGVFEDSDGAVVFRGEEFGLHTRVFLNNDGLPTYEAKELALAKMKHARYAYDTSVVVTGNEIVGYFRVLLEAMRLIYPNLADKTRHVGHGMLKLPEGKMSSRKGNIITGESLIKDALSKARSKISDTDAASEDDKVAIATAVGLGALKYAILKQQTGRDIIYNTERSFSLEGDSGPYLQYAYVRARSVVDKATQAGIAPTLLGGLPAGQISDLARLLSRFPEVVDRALRELSAHHLTNYLIVLAGEFNTYYASKKIIDTADPASSMRVALAQAVSAILQNGLKILGITSPRRM